MIYDSADDTNEHILKVRGFILETMNNLSARMESHDRSKLESPEKEMFDDFTPLLRDSTYGSPEYKRALADMGSALEHHYFNNSHHPEFYGSKECPNCYETFSKETQAPCPRCNHGELNIRPNIAGMSLLDLLEMLCDWKAASLRHSDGDFAQSLAINQVRFTISPDLFEILSNTAKELKWL